MSKISDELREFIDEEDLYPRHIAELRRIADLIDHEMVELPKDADGEYIHIGDVMEWCDSGETLTVAGIGSDVLFYIDGAYAEWAAARNKRHHHEPTVEDVLREFAEKVIDSQIPSVHPTYEDAITEYAAKLRLAGENA